MRSICNQFISSYLQVLCWRCGESRSTMCCNLAQGHHRFYVIGAVLLRWFVLNLWPSPFLHFLMYRQKWGTRAPQLFTSFMLFLGDRMAALAKSLTLSLENLM